MTCINLSSTVTVGVYVVAVGVIVDLIQVQELSGMDEWQVTPMAVQSSIHAVAPLQSFTHIAVGVRHSTHWLHSPHWLHSTHWLPSDFALRKETER